MKFTLMLLMIFSQAVSAETDLTDILFSRETTSKEKQAASDALEETATKPLKTPEAIAEVCYEIDLCAQKEDAAKLEAMCKDTKYGESGSTIGDSCHPYEFKKRYPCKSGIEPLTAKTVRSMSTMLDDNSSLYSVIITDKLLAHFTKLLGVDFCALKDNGGALGEYLENNPLSMKLFTKTNEDTAAMGQYTLNCYDKINPILFKNDKAELLRYFNLIKSITASMEMYPVFKDKVNRGTTLPENVLKEHLKIGNVVCYNGFTSTAVHDPSDLGDHPRNSFLADKCSQRLFINYEENGAVPGRLIDGGSAAKGENEVLFEPGACFRIEKVSPRTDKSKEKDSEECKPDTRMNIEMTLVPSKKP